MFKITTLVCDKCGAVKSLETDNESFRKKLQAAFEKQHLKCKPKPKKKEKKKA